MFYITGSEPIPENLDTADLCLQQTSSASHIHTATEMYGSKAATMKAVPQSGCLWPSQTRVTAAKWWSNLALIEEGIS